MTLHRFFDVFFCFSRREIEHGVKGVHLEKVPVRSTRRAGAAVTDAAEIIGSLLGAG